MSKTQFVLAVLLACAGASTAFGQTIPELARRRPENPIVRGRLQDIPALSLEELASVADLVIEARVSRVKSYLTADEWDILTDYSIVPTRLIAGRLAAERDAPGVSAPLTLTVYGDELRIDGVRVRAVDHNRADFGPGEHFLLFLKPFGEQPGRYQLHFGGAFKIDRNRLEPLLKHSDGAYREIVHKPYDELLAEIEKAAQKK